MDSFSSAVLFKAVEGLSARVAVAAENIANANTPSYRPLRVTFEDALAKAAQKDAAAVRAVEPKVVEETPTPGETGTRIDLELTTDASAAARYSALIEVLNSQIQLRGLAITGNV
jgi:flagellar basal-body rod protein FlgB